MVSLLTSEEFLQGTQIWNFRAQYLDIRRRVWIGSQGLAASVVA